MAGTDGGGSTVREQLGIGMSGTPALTYTTNVMFRCRNFPELHDKGLGYRFIFIGPEGTWLTIVAVNGGDRFRMSIVGSPQKINHTEDDIRAALKRAMGRDFDYEILSVMRWVRRELVADRYAHLPHLHRRRRRPPDVADRRLRHEHRHRRRGRPRLEARSRDQGLGRRRSAALLRRRAAAGRAAQRRGSQPQSAAHVVDPRAPARPGDIRAGRANDAARKEYGDWFAAIMRHEWFANGVMMGYRYDNSPIVWPDGTPAPPDQSHPYIQTARPGARAPHVWLDDGRSTLDLYGRGFVLLRLGANPPCRCANPAGRGAAQSAADLR